MKLIFIRHAEPDYSIDSLTKKGWREAEMLALRTRDWNVKKIYCSPLGRARDTASFTEEKLGMKAEVLPWLKEFFYPIKDPDTGKDRIPWDFMPEYMSLHPELYERDGWYKNPLMAEAGIKEHYDEVCRELDTLLAGYGYVRENGLYRVKEHNDFNIVFFCHLGLSYVCISHLLGVSPVVLWQGMFTAPSSVTILGSEERQNDAASFRCQVIGDTRHLHDKAEPISASGYFTDTFQL